MKFYRDIIGYTLFIIVAFVVLFLPYLRRQPTPIEPENTINVITYSSFLTEWGPGPPLADLFFAKHGIRIKWLDAGNAGLILERLRFKKSIDRPDVVLGIDQFSLIDARKLMNWLDVHQAYRVEKNILPEGSRFRDFLAFDWGPLTFVYRAGEITPPRQLTDLLDKEYFKKIILQDPRLSSPGLQFLLWSIMLFGEKQGLAYIAQLKNSVQILAPSWSSSYSLFQVKKGSMVFSYFTSPFYHRKEEGRTDYQAIVFDHPHPIQVEYAGVPEECSNCDQARTFISFLSSKEAQLIIFEKNYMFPMNGAAMTDADYRSLDNIKYFSPIESWNMIRDKRELVEKWKRVFF